MRKYIVFGILFLLMLCAVNFYVGYKVGHTCGYAAAYKDAEHAAVSGARTIFEKWNSKKAK